MELRDLEMRLEGTLSSVNCLTFSPSRTCGQHTSFQGGQNWALLLECALERHPVPTSLGKACSSTANPKVKLENVEFVIEAPQSHQQETAVPIRTTTTAVNESPTEDKFPKEQSQDYGNPTFFPLLTFRRSGITGC